MTVCPQSFRKTLGHYPTGVSVISGIARSGLPCGMAIGSFTSVSLDPPLVAFCPQKNSASWRMIESSGRFCVNVLAADQADICRHFASRIERKFDAIAFEHSGGALPVLPGAILWIECELYATYDAGDHDLVLGRVVEMEVKRDAPPLIFCRGEYGRFAAAA
ncbi:flavin reductase family protein [Sphingopyxis panaciterrae]|uniref:flavin reductase family protein n=1 Tax=Sphingopyxis panaciterrae TaxID=363841 RepID=UPI0014242DD3|nr:flavin reductase family protein [Sphingopyxis panaciterrae]